MCSPPRSLSACPFLPPQAATSMAMTMQHDYGISLPINTSRCSPGGPPTLHRGCHCAPRMVWPLSSAPVTQRQLTADSPEGTCCLLNMSSSFRSFVEHAFFSSSLMFQIRLFWACAREPAAERPAPLKERNPAGGRLHPGLLLPLVTAPRSAELPRGCRIPRTVLPARGRGVRLGRGRSGRTKAGGEAAAQAPGSPEPAPQGQVPGHTGTHPKHQVHLPQHPAPKGGRGGSSTT